MLREHVLLADGCILETLYVSPQEFRLRLTRADAPLVEYSPGSRTVRGRRSAYEFRSVEKLRYDFEKDAEDAQRQG